MCDQLERHNVITVCVKNEHKSLSKHNDCKHKLLRNAISHLVHMVRSQLQLIFYFFYFIHMPP